MAESDVGLPKGLKASAPFLPDVSAPLEAMLAKESRGSWHGHLPTDAIGGGLHRAAVLLRESLGLAITSQLQSVVATPLLSGTEGGVAAVGLACGREDRRVRVVLPPPPGASSAPVIVQVIASHINFELVTKVLSSRACLLTCGDRT